MPTVLRSGPYRFFFYSADREEPPHVHVQREGDSAKFWLQPIRLQTSSGFSSVELGRIGALVVDHQATFLRAWHDFFG